MSGAVVRAVGVVTGWGAGVTAFPADPRAAAGDRRVIAATPKVRSGDRLRRATRECLLGVDAVEALLEEAGLARADIAGDRTALIYATTAAYGASNRAFVEGGGRALHFPYTAPSAVPAEVAIEFGLHGAYTVLIGGATATVAGLDHAATLLARGACGRAIILAVETFAECEDLFARGRWLVDGPLVEAAAAALLEWDEGAASEANGEGPRLAAPGNTLACGPLIELGGVLATVPRAVVLRAQWRGRHAAMRLRVGGRSAVASS